MNIIKLKIWDVLAFRLLFIFELVFLIFIGICWSMTKQLWDFPTYICGSLGIICMFSQLLILILSKKNYIIFSKKSIIVYFNKNEHKFSWEDISAPLYHSFGDIIILSQNTLEIYIRERDEFVRFFNKFDGKQIYCNKRQFEQIHDLYVLSRQKI